VTHDKQSHHHGQPRSLLQLQTSCKLKEEGARTALAEASGVEVGAHFDGVQLQLVLDVAAQNLAHFGADLLGGPATVSRVMLRVVQHVTSCEVLHKSSGGMVGGPVEVAVAVGVQHEEGRHLAEASAVKMMMRMMTITTTVVQHPLTSEPLGDAASSCTPFAAESWMVWPVSMV